MFDIAQELFGLKISERSDVEVWHEEVKFYDLFDSESGNNWDLLRRLASPRVE